MTQPEAKQERIGQEAAEWHARLDSPEMDWEAFGRWLDADPGHRAAYDSVALLDAELISSRAAIVTALPANDDEAPPVSAKARGVRRWWAGGGVAIAAAMVATMAPQMSFFAAETLVAYRTGPSETRTVNLSDGSRIIIDRNSELALNDDASPRIEMKSGNAWFDIRHDPSRALVVQAGDYQVRDIGTRFELASNAGQLSVAVAEGQVSIVPPGGEALKLAAGQRVDIATRTAEARVRNADAAAMGSWRTGRLIYDNAPLSLVATDLSRYAGKAVSVDPAITDLRLSGVLNIGDGPQLVGEVEALLPVRATVDKKRIHLAGAGQR